MKAVTDTEAAARTQTQFISQMDVLIGNVVETAEEGFVASVSATRLAQQLRKTDPALLAGWLDAQAENLLRDAIVREANSKRARSRRRSAGLAFREQAETANRTGKYDELTGMFSALHVIGPTHIRKRAAEMTGADHRFVSDRYRSNANEYLMLAAFHRAIAERVGDSKTCEVFSEDEYERMFRSIVRTAAA